MDDEEFESEDLGLDEDEDSLESDLGTYDEAPLGVEDDDIEYDEDGNPIDPDDEDDDEEDEEEEAYQEYLAEQQAIADQILAKTLQVDANIAKALLDTEEASQITKLKKEDVALKNIAKEVGQIEEETIAQETSAQIKSKRSRVKRLITAATARKVAKQVGQALSKFFMTPPGWITLAVIAGLIIIAVVVFVIIAAVAAPYENVDVASGKFDTSSGIMGDKFHGARIIYYDNAKAVQQLESNYEDLVIDLITNIDTINGVDVSLEVNYTDERPEILTELIKVVADQTDKSDEAFTELSGHLNIIDHFGYTSLELKSIAENLAEYITLNKDNILTIDESVYTTSNLTDDIIYIFNSNYSNLNYTTPLYFVKDLLLNSPTQMLEGIGKENFVAMIYMPKVQLEFKEAEYMFYMQPPTEENGCPTSVVFEVVHHSTTENVLASYTVDSSWWNDDSAETTAEAEMLLTLPAFYSINTNNSAFQQGNSIYEFIKKPDSIYINTTTITNYFSIEEITTTDATPDSYTYINYLPTNDTEFLYLRFTADGKFQFAEYDVSYE